MTSARREAIRRRLLAWWDAGHRQLPWRFHRGGADPYKVWLSEVMLQQTRVTAVLPYYRRFLERLPTLAALARASEEEVLALWSGLGYYARARRLHAAAQEAEERHGGLPPSYDALLSLPGFGPYTAGAVASIAFALPVPCVDGNATRVLSRLFLVEGARGDPDAQQRLRAIAAELVPASRPGDFNQAVMELGATLCAAAAPRCRTCPLLPLCGARRVGRERELPAPRTRRPPEELHLACAVVRRGDALLLARRPRGGLFGGLWELPSAIVAPGVDPRRALRRHLAAALRLRVAPGAAVASLARSLTHRRLQLTAYECRASSLPRGLLLATPRTWGDLAVSTAMRRLLDAVSGPAPCQGAAARVGFVEGFRRKPS